MNIKQTVNMHTKQASMKTKQTLTQPQRTSLQLPLLLLLAMFLVAATASAATITVGTSTTWSALTGGSGAGGAPNSSDTVIVDGGATLTVNVATAACGTLQLGSSTGGGGAGTIAFNANSQLAVSTTLTVGESPVRTGSITMTSGGLLQCGGTVTVNDLGTFTAGTGTIEYNGAAQTVATGLGAYNNLTLSGSGAKTTTGATVNGILSMEGTATTTGAVATYGAAATLQYKGSAAQTTGTEFPATWTGTGGVRINNASGVTLNAVKTISATSSLTIGDSVANSIFNDGGFQLTSTGTLNLTSGTLRLGSATTATTFPAFATRTAGAVATVEFAAGVAQNVAGIAYPNVIFSGGGAKSMITGTSVSGNLSIAPTGTATASIGAGLNLPVGSLTLGGLGRVNGTWGSTTATSATYHNNTYFTATTGYLTVSTDTRSTPTITTEPTASPITYGQTLASSTFSGGSASVPGTFAWTTSSTAPNAGNPSESVTFTPTDGTSYTTAIGSTTVSVAQKTVIPTVTLNNKVYDGTTAATTIATRSLAGIVGSDDVNLGTSGTVGAFSSRNVGTYTPSVTGLSLSGSTAPNYGLSTTSLSPSASITALPAHGDGARQ